MLLSLFLFAVFVFCAFFAKWRRLFRRRKEKDNRFNKRGTYFEALPTDTRRGTTGISLKQAFRKVNTPSKIFQDDVAAAAATAAGFGNKNDAPIAYFISFLVTQIGS